MLDILDSYLGSATTPELHNILREAHDYLEQVGRDDIGSYFEELLMTDGDRDDGGTLQAVVQGTQGILHQVLTQHGVTLSADTPLETLTNTLKVLVAIPTYGNTGEVLAIILAENSPGVTFAEIAGVVGHIEVDTFLTYVTEISTALIMKIKELVSVQEEETITEEELLVRRQHVEKLRFYCTFIQREQLEIANMIRDGMPVGYPFKVYADAIGRRFETFPIDKIAYEMYGMALVSVDGMNNPRAIINSNINQYIADLNVITKVDMLVSDLLMKLNK